MLVWSDFSQAKEKHPPVPAPKACSGARETSSTRMSNHPYPNPEESFSQRAGNQKEKSFFLPSPSLSSLSTLPCCLGAYVGVKRLLPAQVSMSLMQHISWTSKKKCTPLPFPNSLSSTSHSFLCSLLLPTPSSQVPTPKAKPPSFQPTPSLFQTLFPPQVPAKEHLGLYKQLPLLTTHTSPDTLQENCPVRATLLFNPDFLACTCTHRKDRNKPHKISKD